MGKMYIIDHKVGEIMVQVYAFDSDEERMNNSIVQLIISEDEYYGDASLGTLYKINNEGTDKILHVTNPTYNDVMYTIFDVKDDNSLRKVEFFVDENSRVADLFLDDYAMHPTNSVFSDEMPYLAGGTSIMPEESGVQKSLRFRTRENGPSLDGYTGQVSYVQYNPKNDMRVTLYYEQNVRENNNRIYSAHIMEPFQICIDKKVKFSDKWFTLPFTSQSYIKWRHNYHESALTFSLAVAKDYGTGAVLSKGALNVCGSESITRYYKNIFVTRGYHVFVGFPFCRQYKLEELNEFIEKYGFDSSVPDLLLDYHNGDDSIVRLCQEIYDSLSVLLEEQMKLNLS